MKQITFYLILTAVMVTNSCTNTQIIVSGKNLPAGRLTDSLLLKVNNQIFIKERMEYFLVPRIIKVDNIGTNAKIELLVPSINFFDSQNIKTDKRINIDFTYYFEDSLVNKFITFDSLYRMYPNDLKFRVTVSRSSQKEEYTE